MPAEKLALCVSKLPKPACTLSPWSAPRRVMMLMTPPIASEPYRVERGPLTTSTRSTNSGATFWIAAVPMVPGFMRRPSTSTSTWFDSVPRTNSEVCWPGPPRRATSTPGTKRSASPRSAAGVRTRSSPENEVDAREDFPGGSSRCAWR